MSLDQNESDNEFYDADDIVELVDKKFSKVKIENDQKNLIVDDSNENNDFQSLPVRIEENLNKLVEKVKEIEEGEDIKQVYVEPILEQNHDDSDFEYNPDEVIF
jgi:hypothetical protein